MASEARRYWAEIVEGDYEFEERDLKIEALQKVTTEEVKNFFT